ncbi:MAG: hypothetical protein EAX81_05840 [Candidatus Thorarchaeota archaeon]|nr:hypothetical protein [Candidatus Thorarchaeota archaeon]
MLPLKEGQHERDFSETSSNDLVELIDDPVYQFKKHFEIIQDASMKKYVNLSSCTKGDAHRYSSLRMPLMKNGMSLKSKYSLLQ